VGISFGDNGTGNVGTGAMDFHTVRQRYKKFAKEGYDQDSANRFLRRQIEASKGSMDDESFRYRSANFDYKKMAKDGLVKPLSDKETSEKIKRAQKLTMQAYDKANEMGYKDINKNHLDIAKPQKQG